MKEDFLHFVWKYQLFGKALKTTNNETVVVQQQGLHNEHLAGPDFLNAQIIIGEQRWAGNIEIHLKASDWYAHHHQTDANYSSVILHVVWDHDIEVFNKQEQIIPTVALPRYVDKILLTNYERILQNKKDWIPCASSLPSIETFIWENWIDRLFIERLEQKSIFINQLLNTTNNDWEKVSFIVLAKSFGGNVNGENFVKVASSIPATIFQKMNNSIVLEAIFMGQAGMLTQDFEAPYYKLLQQEYLFAKHKYQLEAPKGIQLHYFKLRPPNFPTIRISQLVNLYTKSTHFFSSMIEAPKVEDLHQLLSCKTSEFWDTHYTFGKTSKKSIKKASSTLIDLIIINAVLPLRFSFERYYGKFEEETFLSFFKSLKPEQNQIISGFNKLGKPAKSAIDSQALIHLKKNYCDKFQCLSCAIGYQLVRKS